jgi:cell division protein ZapA (FtsZ GTPase activity inhibitor)
MRAKKFLLFAALIFICILAIAFIFDARSSALKEYHAIASLDQEIKRFEQKALGQLTALNISDDVTLQLLKSYQAEEDISKRQQKFAELVAHAQAELIKRSDASDPLKRRVVDEFLGALNRRQVVEKNYAELVTQYNSSADSWGKSLARLPATIVP